jgi:phosphoribosylformimino-5-aminoimidazole carboxamide ribotide isomerase
MRFRPCIDLHGGSVKQIVGSSLREGAEPVTNFVSERSAGEFAARFRRDGLSGGHVILLGPGNEAAAREALSGFPGGLQVGGGVNAENARSWLDAGASHVIATSVLFEQGRLSRERLERLAERAGPARLVLDLSCRSVDGQPVVFSDRWQTRTDVAIDRPTLAMLAVYCAEFLVHAVDVEGLQGGPDRTLLSLLGDVAPIPTTYAGGLRSLDEIAEVERLGQGRLDFTVGSALDLYGGSGVRYADLVASFGGGSASG